MDRDETVGCLAAAWARATVDDAREPERFYERTGLDEATMVEQCCNFGRSLRKPMGLVGRASAVGSVLATGLRLGYYLTLILEEKRAGQARGGAGDHKSRPEIEKAWADACAESERNPHRDVMLAFWDRLFPAEE